MLEIIFGVLVGVALMIIIWNSCHQFQKDEFQKTGYKIWRTIEAVNSLTSYNDRTYEFTYLNKKFKITFTLVEDKISFNTARTYNININDIEIACFTRILSEGYRDYYSLCINPKYKKTEIIDLLKALKKDTERKKLTQSVSHESIFN